MLHSYLNSPFLYDKGPRYGYSSLVSLNGEFEWFDGEETIYKNDVKVYECKFHGGIII